jgi:hypothetical protein
MHENIEDILVQARVVDSWGEFLDNFLAETYPTIFEPRGINLQTALLLWKLNALENQLLCDCDAEG